VLAVTDTGTGMDQVTCARVFEPLFTTKREGKGMGLGLTVVYDIVKQSQGIVCVHSELGQGTTFKVYLPRVADEAQPAVARRPPRTRLRGTETVLLVEREQQTCSAARSILESRGYRVLGACKAEDAWLLCDAHDGPIDIMITDIGLPDTSGRELAKRVSALRPDMRTLFMSGGADDAGVRRGVPDEGMAHLGKPFAPYALLQMVRDLLDETEPG
jgi:CheY-like chemotaxis protein